MNVTALTCAKFPPRAMHSDLPTINAATHLIVNVNVNSIHCQPQTFAEFPKGEVFG